MNCSLSPLRLGLVAAALAAIFPSQLLAAGSDQITPEGMAQVAALVREKEARTPAQRKIDSNLLYEIKMRRGERIAQGVETQATGLTVDEKGGTAVEIRADVTDGLLKELSSVGATVVHVSGPYRTVVASVPLSALEGLAARPDVFFILPHFPANTWQNPAARPATRQDDVARPSFAQRAQRVRDFLGDVLIDPPSMPQVGSVNSQGDTTHQANTARSTIGPNGSGIKIGVLSNGVNNMALSQGMGDLGPVTVLPGQTGSGDEGTAMLEIVHDLAPQAQLYFATANPSIAQFAQNVRDLRAAGCDIIIDDVFYFVETPFQDGQAPSVVSTTNGGAVIQAVNDVVAAGAMYFSSAGNQGNLDDGTSSCYQGDWADGGTLTGAVGGNVHNFGGGAQSNLIQTGSGNAINLYWADPLGGSANDYDLYVFNNALTAVVASSTNIQNGTQDPFEQTAGNTTNNRVVVLKKTAAAVRFFHITINANGAGHLAVSTEGTTKGHSMAAGAFSVGATPAAPPGPFPGAHTAANVTETFTSDGPRRIFFNADGTAITPGNFSSTGGLLRQKPDITAADKVSVTGVGGFPTTFSGTSAAAPHAGAIAALLKSGLPAPTNAQIRTALTSTALDIETPGVDRDTGAGIVMPLPAMAALGIVAQAALDRGALTVAELAGNGDGDGNVEKGETGTLVIGLVNNGLANATGVTATLTTTSPGVTIVPPTNVALPYADLATGGGTASNATPYQFQLGAAYTCSSPVDFVLTVTYNDGSARSKVLAFQVSLATGFEVTTTLDATAPPASPSYTPTTGLQTNRVTRDGNGSSCGAAKAFPGITAATTPRFDAYTFVATSTGCNIVTLTAGPAGSILNFAVVYSGSFNPAALGTNYLADAGSSPIAGGGQINFGFNATAGQTYVVVISEVPGAGTTQPYTVKVNGTSLTTCNFAAQADLAITKTDGVTTAVPGGGVTYTITASNAGPNMAVGATVADTFPGILGVTWTCVGAGGGTCTAAGAGNINDLVNLPSGGSVTYTATASISAAATGTLSNTATVAAPGGVTDPVLGNNSATDTDTLTPQANLGITKTDGVTTAVPGGIVTYTITASNAGPSNALGATVADTFPGSLIASWTCVGAGGGTCTAAGAGNINDVVNLPAGGSVTYTASATISAAATGTLSNTATVTAPGGVTDPTPANNSATDTDTLTPQANLAITKTDGVTTAIPGGSVTYTITASNAGPSNATGATVADTFPASLTATWTCVGAGGGTCSAAGAGTINDVVNLPAGSVTYTASATINAAATGTLSNTATVAPPGGVTDPTPGNNSATDSDTLTSQADVAITKTDGVTTAVPGGSVTYTITASNAGPSNATGATVADTFPASLTATWTCVGAGGGTCTAAGAGNINDVVNLPVGGSVTYTATATISAAATGTLSNTATVAVPAGATDPTPGNNSATDTDTLTPQANLGITKTDGVTTAAPGGSVTYTITASNAGPSNATGATVADTFPASLTATWTCAGAGGGTCTAAGAGNINDVVNLPSGGSVTYTASATINAAATGTLSNTATVTAPGGVTDPTPGNNSATDTDTLVPQADLAITKTDGVTTANPGGSVTYTIVASNAGPSNATGATVADTFPASLTATWTCVGAAGGTCTAAGAGNINDVVNLPSGGSVTYTVSATISAAATGTLSNTATVTAPGGVTDPTPGNNSATDTDTLVAATSADLSIVKTDGLTFYYPGQTVTYTIVVGTAGPAPVTGATVADILPADLTGATWTCAASAGSACGAPSGTGNINTTVDLPLGGTATFTLTATTSPTATGSIVNTATVAAPGGVIDPTLGNNTTTDTDTRKGGSYHTVTPCRVLDTRNPAGPYGAPALTPASRPFLIAGQCGVPANATAVAINLTVTNGTTTGFVVASPTGGVLPPVSTINYGAGQTRANNAVVGLGAGGQLSLTASGTVDAILDVAGYFVE